jgi:hypothetical protein
MSEPETENGRHSAPPPGLVLEGIPPTAQALLEGIAAKVSCLDSEFEGIREAQRLQDKRIDMMSEKLDQYRAAVERQTALLMAEFQRHFSVPDPTKPQAP